MRKLFLLIAVFLQGTVWAQEAGIPVNANRAAYSCPEAISGQNTSVPCRLNVRSFGAKGDTVTLANGAITNGSPTFTSSGAGFTSADTGKTFIVRGAGAAGIPLVATGTFVNSTTITLASNAATTVTGARADYGTLDVAAFKSATSACPTQGCTLYVPAGRYMHGAPSLSATTWLVSRNNIKIVGDGMGSTLLIYTSQLADHVLYPKGIALAMGGVLTATHYTNNTISDFSIEDVNNTTAFAGGTNPNALDVWYVSNLVIERIEIINAKGNAAVGVAGSLSGGIPTENNVWVRGCIITSTAAGGYVEGDGFNIGNYSNVYFTNNTINAVGRHAFEGGGVLTDAVLSGNTVDMENRGLSGLNPTGGQRVLIANNSIINVTGNYFGIDLTADVGAGFNCEYVNVNNNLIKKPGYGMRFQNTSGSGTGVTKLQVFGNTVESDYGILIGATDFPDMHVSLNTFRLTANCYILAQAGAPGGAAPIAGRLIVIENNILPTALSYPLDLVNTFSNWRSTRQLKVQHNTIGIAPADAVRSQYGTSTTANDGAGGTLTANTSKQIGSTLTFYGAIPGDLVVLNADASWPASMQLWGRVTAQDTIEVWAYNPTAGSLTIPNTTHPIYVWIERR